MTDSGIPRLASPTPRQIGAVARMLVAACVLFAVLPACDGGDGLEAPQILDPLSDQDFLADEPPREFDLTEVFSGEELTFQASTSDPDVVTATVEGATLVVEPQTGGETSVTVTAQNSAGEVEAAFIARVDLPDPPGPPS